MPVGETLQAFALERGESADEHGVRPHRFLFDCVAHGDGAALAAACDHVRVVREQRERRVAVGTDPETRPATQFLVAGGDLLVDGIGAAGADKGRLLHAGVCGKLPAEGPVADDAHLVADILREPEGRADGILASPDGGTR